jgi:hypothetical protein
VGSNPTPSATRLFPTVSSRIEFTAKSKTKPIMRFLCVPRRRRSLRIVASATSKSWACRYWMAGKERWHGLGSFKDVSLKNARLWRDAARLRVKGDRSTLGSDIVQEKRAAREEVKAAEAITTLRTFEQCAEACPMPKRPRSCRRSPALLVC